MSQASSMRRTRRDSRNIARPEPLIHVALEVGDVQEALAFYVRIFRLRIDQQGPGRAIIGMADQFLALLEEREPKEGEEEMPTELPLHSLHWERRAPNWVVAAVSGFAAGAVLMVLDLLWSSIVDTGGPWRTSHMIAPIFLGADVVPSTGFNFSIGVVAIALAVHYALGIAFGLVLAAIMAPLHLDATVLRALVTGAVFGLILYAVNFFGMVHWFLWLADLRGWATVAAHLVFGMVAALLYWKLERSVSER